MIGPSASGQAGGSGGAATHLRQAVVGPNNLPNWGAELRYVLGSQTSATTKLQKKNILIRAVGLNNLQSCSGGPQQLPKVIVVVPNNLAKL